MPLIEYFLTGIGLWMLYVVWILVPKYEPPPKPDEIPKTLKAALGGAVILYLLVLCWPVTLAVALWVDVSKPK